MVAGTLYGFIIGLVPVAGATTALITIYAFIDLFRHDPYTLVIFTTAIVASSTIGDSFSSIMLNVPGAGGSAATMVDGFPLAKQGQGARALSAAITTSGANGLLWGALVFFMLPLYGKVVMSFGIPEQLAFLLLAFATVCFVSSDKWVRGIIALLMGIVLGLVGHDPTTGEHRMTLGWDYLAAGIQLAPLMAGILAMPELIQLWRDKSQAITFEIRNYRQQIVQGMADSWQHKRDGLRGGFIGAVVGIIPGIGGSVADWLSYGQTVAANPREKTAFGDGNIKGVIGCEGANNSQKATSYVPTVLFGIPGAPFEVVVMSLLILVGLELGTPALLKDAKFFETLTWSYMGSIILTLVISFWAIKHVTKIFNLPKNYWLVPLMLLILWSSVQYTGYWEDYAVFFLCVMLGLAMKQLQLSRPAFIIGFVLSDRLEKSWVQYSALFDWYQIALRPISGLLLAAAVIAMIYGIFYNKTRISYT